MTAESRVMCLIAAALCGFFFRLGERSVGAQPPPCPKWDCKDVYVLVDQRHTGGNPVLCRQSDGNADEHVERGPVHLCDDLERVATGEESGYVRPLHLLEQYGHLREG